MKKIRARHIIAVSVTALVIILCAAANIVMGLFTDTISKFFYGVGISTDSEEARAAIAAGNILCEEIEDEAIVLLKNENNTLPLVGVDKINVFGWGSTQIILAGTGSGNVDTENAPTIVDSLQEVGITANPALWNKYTAYKSDARNPGGYIYSVNWTLFEPGIETYTAADWQSYKAYSDAAILVIARLGGEDNDIPADYLTISDTEQAILNEMKGNFGTVIVVVNTCNAMELGFLSDDKIGAAVAIGSPGQTGLYSLGKVLSGSVNPSGRTSDIYAYDAKSSPAYGVNEFGSGTSAGGNAKTLGTGVREYANADKFYYIDYNEGVYVGYRYYETRYAAGSTSYEPGTNYDEIVQYPFGYGMSYTDFTWEVTSVNPAAGAELKAGDKISVDVKVTNAGEVPGKDVVQCYYTPPYYPGGVEKPYVSLAGFSKTDMIPAGGSDTVTIQFDVRTMASYDHAGVSGTAGYMLDAGAYAVKIMCDSHSYAAAEDGFDVADFVTAYSVPSIIRYETDDASGRPVVNRFTGTQAYDGISVDGSGEEQPVKFLSRNDWSGTFPDINAGVRNMTESVKPTKSYTRDDTESDKQYEKFPTFGANNGLHIDDFKNIPYKDDRWNGLLDQLTLKEACDLIEYGGYETVAAPSVGKKAVVDLDGPQGLNTQNVSSVKFQAAAYPSSTCIAQTWNTDLAYRMGESVGNESRALGVSGWYAPGVNIHRSPYSGRNFEYYSEDPLLTGIMGAKVVRGALDKGLYCYVKHFAVNDVETRRSVNGLYTWATEQAVREIYLKPFEIAVKEGGTLAIMTAFNRIGATWTGGSYGLITEVLRGEWGFEGTVLTDYYINTAYGYMSVDQGLRAGGDCWLTGVKQFSTTPSSNTKTAQWNIRRACKNILFTYSHAEPIESNPPSAVWWVYVGIVEFVLLAGCGIWIWLTLRKPKNR